jgi:hypothetical protein
MLRFGPLMEPLGASTVAADDVGHVLHLQPQRGQLHRVDLHAHGRLLLAADGHLRDAGDLRDLLRENVLGVVVDRGDRQHVRMHGQDQNRRVGRIDLAIGGRRRQVLGQLAAGRVDAGLHVLRRRIDVAIQIELQGDLRVAQNVGRGHLRQAGNFGELVFQRRGDGGRHGFGTGAPGQAAET